MTTSSAPSRPTLARPVLKIHRWLSLGAAIFWLLQAITGVLIVFHWEINDAAISPIERPADLAAIERRIDALAPPRSAAIVQSVWDSGSNTDRYVVFMQDAEGVRRGVRLAGDGTVLRNADPGDDTLMEFLVGFHHDLLGEWGSWIVAISGVLLCSNLVLGLVAAWPKRGTWRRALVPARKGPAAARLYSWHRAVGLWAVVPALVIAATGTLMKFEDSVGTLVGAEPVSMPANPSVGPPVGFAAAARAAVAAIPGSSLTSVGWPKPEDATYSVRVRAPGEIRRDWGASVVLVDANNGAVRGVFPIGEAAPSRQFMMALFPIHTGEAGGFVGRLLSIAIGLWLITMIVAGILLWSKRRKPRVKA